MGRLSGKVAMITGGAGALGSGFAAAFAREGAQVVIADVSGEGVNRAKRQIGSGAIGITLDISRNNEIAAAMQFVERECGGLDILVNNAGYFEMPTLFQAAEQHYDRIFAVNVKGLFFATQSAATQMIRLGKAGRIINIASEAGRRGEKFNSLYCASKAAVISLTQSLALELVGHGITVNAISPGLIDTPMLRKAAESLARLEGRSAASAFEAFSRDVPLGRLSTPDDLTGCALFLASDESRYVVGQTYNVDGGRCLN